MFLEMMVRNQLQRVYWILREPVMLDIWYAGDALLCIVLCSTLFTLNELA
jgi:hypothetical protein